MIRLIGIFLMLLTTACEPGSGRNLNANGRPIGEGATPGNEPTLANIQARVFTPICSVCHVGAAAPQGLRLDASNAFNDLVGVRSRQASGLQRVNPFNPDISYLVRKIEGSASVGEQMPLGGPPLPDEDIQLIRQWITDGAMNTPSAAKTQTRVTAINLQPARISLEFDGPIDASSILTETVVLRPSGTQQTADYRVAAHPANPRAVIIEWDRLEAGVDYRLSINSDASIHLVDMAGRPARAFDMEFRP